MMLKKVLLLTMFLLPKEAFAAPPKIEFFMSKYDGYNCLSRAEKALKKSGFKMKKGSFSGEDRVGYLGNYKGAIGCSSEVRTSVVFVVAGPNYKDARALARKMQRNFMSIH